MSSDPVLNCLLEVCCGRQAADRLMAKTLVSDGVCEDLEHAQRCVAWFRHRFDFAPVNTLAPLRARWLDLAQGAPYKETPDADA